MTFTGGSWSFRYQVDNVEFGRLVAAYVAHKRRKWMWAYWIWNLIVIGTAGLGLGVIFAAIVSLTSMAFEYAVPKTINQDLRALAWGVVIVAVVIGLLFCLRFLNTVVNVPKSNGAFELTVAVNHQRVWSRTSGMNFSFEIAELKEFVELKSMYVFVHPLAVLVFIPRQIFPNEIMADEFAAFCRQAMDNQG